MISECPECRQRFTIQPQDLAAAGGKVRCGGCLTVFDARRHPVADPRNEPEPAVIGGFSATPNFSRPLRDTPRRTIGTLRLAGWLLGILLLGIPLSIQWLLAIDHPLLRQSPWQDPADWLCQHIRCVGRIVAIDDLAAGHLNIHEDPSHDQALKVETSITNRSDYAVPAPALALRFSSLQGEVVAERQFQPHEYLAGALQQQSDIPPHSTVLVALDIVDPGKQATNYQLILKQARSRE